MLRRNPVQAPAPRVRPLGRLRLLPVLATLASASLSTGCTQDRAESSGGESSPSESGTTAGDFISDDPWAEDGALDWGGYDSGDHGGDETGWATEGDGGDGDGDDDAGQTVLEADIVQFEGDTLYALSEWSGLSVIDATDPTQLDLLGQIETTGEAFEMYVDAAQVFVMLNDAIIWDQISSPWNAATSSILLALDASDPENIEIRGEFTLPGHIQDSRRVGDILYLVNLEDGFCDGCDHGPRTVITSVNIADSAAPTIVDQLEFTAADETWAWRRSVAATADRLYVAGGQPWVTEGAMSEIDVVDISDPDGALVLGAKIFVEGTIDSRWQMNEYQGVLRTVSQNPDWWSSPPVIETFAITDSHTITPLGQTDMVLPMPESLRSVRFDGPRAFAITAVETDPLFTIDLSDPANPAQIGELEIPGWVYHMEVRGDRILALGFDELHPDGALNVSLFDVSDFANPTLRRRVHFGGNWGDFAEGQDQIHKAFNILDEEGLLLVPFSGWDRDWLQQGCYEAFFRSGVQLVDWIDDDLLLRGVAETRGRTRRSFIHREHLFAVSDAEVATFDMQDRDLPSREDSVGTGAWADRILPMGPYMIRQARDWSSRLHVLEVVSSENPGQADPIGRIDLMTFKGQCEIQYLQDVLVEGETVFVVMNVRGWDSDLDSFAMRARVQAFDVSDPSNPALIDTLDLPLPIGLDVRTAGGFELPDASVAISGNRMVLAVTPASPYDETSQSTELVVDVSDPADLRLIHTLNRAGAYRRGGLQVSDGIVRSWRANPVPGQPEKIRVYLETLRLEAQTAAWEIGANIPGVVAAYDEDSGEIWAVNYRLKTIDPPTGTSCYQLPRIHRVTQNGECVIRRRDLLRVDVGGTTASILSETPLDEEDVATALHVTGTRGAAVYFDSIYEPNTQDRPYSWSSLKLVARESGKTSVSLLHGPDHGFSSFRFLGMDHNRLLGVSDTLLNPLPPLVLIDTEDPMNPTVQQETSFPGWGGCRSPLLEGDRVLCPLAQQGVSIWNL